MGDVLDMFGPATREWFRGAFTAPTDAQRGAWTAIAAGKHALVVAPTGSGKTLSAFLWAIDRVFHEKAAAPPSSTGPGRPGAPKNSAAKNRTRILYVSPLKALGVDVERNLRSPLVGIGQQARRLGIHLPELSVGVRSGDTTSSDRRKLVTAPPDILITTPESLYLMLTSRAGDTLSDVHTVIIDEVHAVAATKRGAHLAVTLERLDALRRSFVPDAAPAQRIGLSATVRPIDEVASFLGGAAPVEIVAPRATKMFDMRVVVPIDDLTNPPPAASAYQSPPTAATGDDERGDEGEANWFEPQETTEMTGSVWPHVEEAIVDRVLQNSSTIVFANSRRLAERLTGRLNEIYAERLGLEPAEQTVPAAMMAQAGATAGAPPVLAKAHHGSVSKEQRAQVEEELKSGILRCVVATSSLELGIDMGAVDLVIQVDIDGVAVSGWFTEDLTLAELRSLHCPTAEDRILTLDELLHVLTEEANGRPLGLHLEIKHPTYFESVGLPMTAELLDVLHRHGLHQPGKGVWLQSFDDAFLRRLAPKTPLPLVQLIEQGQAFSCTAIATYAQAIGPDRALVLLGDARPTGLVREAHEAGLEVFVWTLRGDVAQARRFFGAGVDGVFTDYAERALVARDGLLELA